MQTDGDALPSALEWHKGVSLRQAGGVRMRVS